jgi:hypothetical protein
MTCDKTSPDGALSCTLEDHSQMRSWGFDGEPEILTGVAHKHGPSGVTWIESTNGPNDGAVWPVVAQDNTLEGIERYLDTREGS